VDRKLSHIRLATTADVPALHRLIAESVRGLMPSHYSRSQLEAALGTLLGLDTQLISDQTYFVAEVTDGSQTIVAGCGGWIRRETLFGSDHRSDRDPRLLDPAVEPARIRAFFIHPDWARRGIGSQILHACETAAQQAGFRQLEMGATLSGMAMYRARGYRELEQIEVPMANGESLTVVRMGKSLQS